MRRIVEEADGTLGDVPVEDGLERSTMEGLTGGKLDLWRDRLVLRMISSPTGQRGQRLRSRPKRRRSGRGL